jgi:hypothetical protein
MYQRPERVKMDSQLAGLGACTATATQLECTQLEVHREMDILANSLSRLEDAAKMLGERLSCVTMPPAPADAENKASSPPVGSSMGSSLRQSSDRANQVAGMLEQLQRDLAI